MLVAKIVEGDSKKDFEFEVVKILELAICNFKTLLRASLKPSFP